MANYSTIPHATVDDGSTPLAQDSKATPWRRLVASALVVSFTLGVIGTSPSLLVYGSSAPPWRRPSSSGPASWASSCASAPPFLGPWPSRSWRSTASSARSCRRRSSRTCGRFPFLGVGNQFLTPLQYANLARLGHELAAEPLAQLVEARAAATRRKSSPAAALIGRKRAEASECADCPLLSSRF